MPTGLRLHLIHQSAILLQIQASERVLRTQFLTRSSPSVSLAPLDSHPSRLIDFGVSVAAAIEMTDPRALAQHAGQRREPKWSASNGSPQCTATPSVLSRTAPPLRQPE